MNKEIPIVFNRGKAGSVFVRLTKEEKLLILEIARKENVSMSEVVRTFMNIGLSKYLEQGGE